MNFPMPIPLLIIALVSLCPRVHAMVISAEAVQSQLAGAPFVADLTIRRLETSADKTTFATFQATALINEVIRAQDSQSPFPSAGHEITIEGAGGELNDRGILFSGLARPRLNFRYRAHLKRNSAGSFQIVGQEAGLMALQPSRSFSRNRTDGSNGDGDGAFLFWDESFLPIPYYISAPTFQGLSHFAAAVDASFKSWRDPQDVTIEFLPMGCSSGSRNENDGLNHIILVTDVWPFSDPQVIAITRNFYIAGTSDKAGLILDSDILLNGVHHRFTTTGEPGANDVQNIVTHEAGHFLGLGHEITPPDTDAVMFANATTNETKKRTLKASDLSGLREGYGGVGGKHEWTGSVCNLEPATGCGAAHNAPAAPGNILWALGYLGLLLGVGRIFRGRLSSAT